MQRRNFLAASLAAGLRRTVPAKGRYSPLLAGQAYVWSQYYSRRGEKIEDHFDEVLRGFRNAGYSTMELVAQFFAPEFAERTAGLLKQHKLRTPVVYNGGEMHTEAGADKTIATTLDLARRVKKATGQLDAINFNANPLPRKAAKSDGELRIQAAAINRLASELGRLGVRLFIHQHDPEMMENAREWRQILANTDAKNVLVCLDTHWVYRGGQDVMTLLREAGPRLASLHLRNSKNGIWSEELSDGDVDYRTVAGYLKESGFSGYLVVELAWDKETELTRPLESALRRSLDYAKDVFRS